MTDYSKYLHRTHTGEMKRLNPVCLSILLILAVTLTVTTLHLSNQNMPGTAPGGSATQAPEVTVAASNSSAAAKASADYLCDGVNDQQEIQAALDALSGVGGRVILTEGTFQCTESVIVPPGTALIGQGAEETDINLENSVLHLKHEGTSLEGLNISGSRYNWEHQWDAPVFITASNIFVRNVTGTADNTVHAVFFVASLDTSTNGKAIENIEFSRCRALNPGTFGFMLSASQAATNKLIQNVTFIDCEAINCGKDAPFNPWVTGFNFAEQNDIEGLQVVRCRAEGNWESGFHVESSQNKTNIVMIDCISNENAQKEKTGVAQTVFGAGYLVNGDMRLINCTSENNSVGFYCTGGGFDITNCTEESSRIGYAFSYLNDTRGARLTASNAIGEWFPIFFSRGGMADVILDKLTISSENASSETAGITVTHDVRNAPEILVQDSRVQGYRYGINNTATGAVQVRNVEVSGAIVDFINCDIQNGAEQIPEASMLSRAVLLPDYVLPGI